MIDPKIEKVSLVLANKSGVLTRVASRIRREGWNIKRLTVDETSEAGISNLEMEIEGTHTKLAQVMDRILNLDCVVSISMMQDGREVTRKRENSKAETFPRQKTKVKAGAKPDNAFRILAINPGSSSTKFAVYDDEKPILEEVIRHNQDKIASFPDALTQKDMRCACVLSKLEEAGIPLSSLDAISGRGGLLKPIESGVYPVNERMLADLSTATASIHASALGAIIAAEIAKPLSIPAFVVDPVVVDEMDPYAKLTGIPGIERTGVFHALNQKAIARRLAKQLGMPYENARFVTAHMGGGITVGAHRYGRVIDVNNALSGEGPFTPERAGSVPAVPVIDMCFSGEYTKEEMIEKVSSKGGMRAYLGTGDLFIVQKMINDGDEFAALVLDSMAYQVSKEIGAMVAVLEGKVDAIILTGGLAKSNRFTGSIKQRVDKLAPVHVFPGEDELLALMSGALRVLRGEERISVYE